MKKVLTVLWVLSIAFLLGGKFLFNLLPLTIAGGFLAAVFVVILCIRLYGGLKKDGKFSMLVSPGNGLPDKLKSILALAVLTALVIALSMTGLLFTVLTAACVLAGSIQIIRNTKLLNVKDIVISLLLSLVVLLGMLKEDPVWILFNVLPTGILYLAGMALARKTGFSPAGQDAVRAADLAKRAGIGILIVLPSAILNSYADMGDTGITQWWHPFLAIKPAVFEEIFLRFFLITFLLFVFSRVKSFRFSPLFASILVSSLCFAFLHGFNPIGSIVMFFLFAVPYSLAYLKYGLEATISGHFVTDFIRYTTALYLFT